MQIAMPDRIQGVLSSMESNYPWLHQYWIVKPQDNAQGKDIQKAVHLGDLCKCDGQSESRIAELQPRGLTAAWGCSLDNPYREAGAAVGIETQSVSKAVSFPFCLILVVYMC